ncbi:GNAT family N-acetyltransferase [Lysinibacillus sphaericus]|uniref:Acetyltransferase n=1 Tax=Lysinibacillus sphaericus OT4b.31 TaxID=1285586 RepID=R7ZFX6_LYSSH|nr:GNAT family N-acetyltransferase [Lysinibacillus sphaericus]EON73020.1 acetyltransferase [Lysinibacillus sphaericus OT4b.31]
MVTYNKNNLELVEFNRDDILGLIELSASVEWDYDEFEIRTVLSSGKIFGHKDAEGTIVSSAAIIKYDTYLASIGMVIVHKEHRGLGLGKDATQKCLDSVAGDFATMLIATKEGAPLYEKMGFKTVDYIKKYLAENYIVKSRLTTKDMNFENFNKSDFNELVALDEAAFGDKRRNFLQNRVKQAKQCLVVKDHHANIIGFGISILGPVNLILGPIVAPDAQTAALILNNLALNHQGKLRIDVPAHNDEFIALLEQSGFKEASNPPVMIINSIEMPPRNKMLFAIAAQIFG